MADEYSAIYGDSDYWDGTTAWGYDVTSDVHSPDAHANEAARDAQYDHAFTSVAAWVADRDGNSNLGDDVYGIIQTPWDADDTSIDNNLNWGNTPNTLTVRSIGAARHAGVWDDGEDSPHRLVGDAATRMIRLTEANITLDGLQIHNTDVGNNTFCIDDSSGYAGTKISNCILNCSNEGVGIYLNATASTQIWNNVIYCPHEQGDASEGIYLDDVGTIVIYNNTIYNFDDGIEIDAVGTSVAIKNNTIFTNTDDIDDGIGVTIDYNASDDGDGDNSQAPSGADWANEMSNYATYDFTLDGEGNLYDNGTFNPGNGLFSDDITGAARTDPQSIGAFEYDIAVGVNSIPLLMHQFGQRRAS